MRYALKESTISIAAAIGDDYLKNHILKSLDSFFRKSNDECIISSVGIGHLSNRIRRKLCRVKS